MAVTNEQMLEAVAMSMPNMTSQSAKATAAAWKANPGKMFQDNNNTTFLNTLATFGLDTIRVQDFDNRLETENVITKKARPYGNIQRLYTPEIPSVDGAFQQTAVDGQTPNMFEYRVIKPTQKFAYSNITYNNKVTVFGSSFYTNTFNDYQGLVDWQTALTESLLASYSRWRFALYMDVIGRQGTNNADSLQDTQTVQVTFANVNKPTIAEVAEFCKVIENILDYASYSGKKYNEDKFGYVVRDADVKILVRIGFKNAMRYAVATANTSEGFAINPERVNRILDRCIEVPYLGVPKYYVDNTKAQELYPVYNSQGMITGLNTSEAGTGTAVALDAAYAEDDGNTLALIMDRNRINYITAMTDEGQSTELQLDYTVYNNEGDMRNLYSRVLGNPDQGSGARLFGDSSYLFIQIVNGTAQA